MGPSRVRFSFLVFLVVSLAAPAAFAVATLDVTAGVLTYTAGAGTSNNLTISVPAASYIFTDTAETITLTANATGAGWTGSGTNTVTGLDTSVSSMVINLGDGTTDVV